MNQAREAAKDQQKRANRMHTEGKHSSYMRQHWDDTSHLSIPTSDHHESGQSYIREWQTIMNQEMASSGLLSMIK